ncbi:MAG: cytochrome c peroxidase [Bacteroidota bacterium]
MKSISLIYGISICCSLLFLHTNFSYPTYFPEPVYEFSKNPLTKEKVELGRKLFYDPLLSKDGSISCASCHSPYNAFAHTDHDLSHGIHDQIGTRNAPPLFNLAWQKLFMWDGAINHLDMQALAPISHPAEMGESLESVIHKLRAQSSYQELFSAAFKKKKEEATITGEKVLKALSQFQLSLVSTQSKYDSVRSGSTHFNEQETKGYALFQKHCNSCHTEPLFSNYSFADNGLPVDTTLNDQGRWTISQKEEDRFKFKVPSLRNLSYTYPYMHDGRFRKLNQVLKHYSTGIQARESLAPELSQGMEISSRDRADLIAFLLTLNDKAFVFAPKHQYPREQTPGPENPGTK